MRDLLDLVPPSELADENGATSAERRRRLGRRDVRPRGRDERVLVMPRRRLVLVVQRNTEGSFVPIGPPIDTVRWREGVLVVRYHARTSFFGRLWFVVQTVSQTSDEPQVIFEASKPAAEILLAGGTAAPALLVASFDPGPAARVALQVEPGSGSSAVGVQDITVSIELLGRRA